MGTEDQTAIVDFLGSSSTHGGMTVERIDTHSSIVFLAGTRAWKLKRAVRFDYLDFSTAVRRKLLCEAEVRLNRRTAPSLYRGVVAITRARDGSLALGGPGEPVDWVVEMARFDQEALLDRLAAGGRLSLDTMVALASALARFHSGAEPQRNHGSQIRVPASSILPCAVGSPKKRVPNLNVKARCSTSGGSAALCVSATVTSTFETSCCSTASPRCSTRSSSTTT